MYTLTVTIDNDKDLKKLNDLYDDLYITILDERKRHQRKDSFVLKNKYAARENPFVEIFKNGEFYHVIYKEACEDPIKEINNICM